MSAGYIHSTESFGSVDGPGVRYIIFTSGCPMRCKYCHNPDTWNLTGGKLMEPKDLISDALKCKSYWNKYGGITVSGGEPLFQIDFLLELFTLAKEKNINTCIDTSGAPFTTEGEWFEKFNKLLPLCDLFLLDIKHIDEDEHLKLTSHTGKNIKQLFKYLDEKKKLGTLSKGMRRQAAMVLAQAPVPQAIVTPLPLSQTRMRSSFSPMT